MAYVDNGSPVRNTMSKQSTPISKTMGGYAVTFDGYRIEMTQKLFDSINETLFEAKKKDSKDVGHLYAYWLGYLISMVKTKYKRVKCVLCKKDIHKRDMMNKPRTHMVRPDVHKKCYDDYKKKESAGQLLRDGDQEFKKKQEIKDQKHFPGLSNMKKIQTGVAKALGDAKKANANVSTTDTEEIFNV